MKQWIKEVARGKKGSRDLTYQEAQEAARTIISGEATDAQLAAFLVAERLKGESPEELIAFIHEFRAVSRHIPLSSSARSKLIDFAGPYNGRKTFAATIPVSLLLADRGYPIYLHSSDSLPPKKGIALHQITEKLGIPVSLSPEQIAFSIEKVQIGLSKTENICQPLADIRKVREEIGVRSFINTAEKSLNLANASTLMVGIFHKTVVEQNVAILRALGFEKAYIVQGAEGSEDLPIHRVSFLYEVTQENVSTIDLNPEDYGLKHRRDTDKEVLTLDQQVDIIQDILDGTHNEEQSYYRDQVLYNAGVRYFLFGETSTIKEGIDLAREQLNERKGAARLALWKGL